MDQEDPDPLTETDPTRRGNFARVNRSVVHSGLIDLGYELYRREYDTNDKPDVAIGKPMGGDYHILYTLLVDNRPRWLIRIPSTGVRGKWTSEAAADLASEAQTMNYLSCCSAGDGRRKLPIPRVHAYSDTTENSIGCPYIALSYVDGVPLYKLWFQHRLKPGLVDLATVQTRRMRALDGIIEAMEELGKHTFDTAGRLVFAQLTSEKGHTFLGKQSKPQLLEIGPARFVDHEIFGRPSMELDHNNGETPAAVQHPAVSAPPKVEKQYEQRQKNKQLKLRAPRGLRVAAFRLLKRVMDMFRISTKPARSTPLAAPSPARAHDDNDAAKPASRNKHGSDENNNNDDDYEDHYFMWGPSSVPADYVTAPLDMHRPKHPFQQGVHALLRKLIQWIPDPFVIAGETNRFVLRHPDLDMQNILVDEDGTVVSIIDWDGVAAVPRCLGNECYPTFLIGDWDPAYHSSYPLGDDDNPDKSVFDPESPNLWENSPATLRKLRNAYLERITQLQQQDDSAFSPFLATVCRQSVVTENIAMAASYPPSRPAILDKIVTESWAALEKAGGENYTDVTFYDLIEMLATGEVDADVMEALEKAFLLLLKTVDT